MPINTSNEWFTSNFRLGVTVFGVFCYYFNIYVSKGTNFSKIQHQSLNKFITIIVQFSPCAFHFSVSSPLCQGKVHNESSKLAPTIALGSDKANDDTFIESFALDIGRTTSHTSLEFVECAI